MIQVLCSETELQEYGEVIAVGDRVERLAAKRDWTYYGSALDAVPWAFDRYADEVRGAGWTIRGRVVDVAAVYVRLAMTPQGFTAAPGSAWLEPLTTTATTRIPVEEIDWGPMSAPDADGVVYRGGSPVLRPGDEHLSGWLLLLEEEEITAGEHARTPSGSA